MPAPGKSGGEPLAGAGLYEGDEMAQQALYKIKFLDAAGNPIVIHSFVADNWNEAGDAARAWVKENWSDAKYFILLDSMGVEVVHK